MPGATREHAIAAYRGRPLSRRIRAGLRDTWVLMREFREGLLLFVIVLAIGAVSFRMLWNFSQDASMRFIEALYHVLTMTFFQPTLEFPREWYLDAYFFIMPLLGIIALARGLADFASLLFNRNMRQAQWEEAVASTYNNHIIVAGLGHLGLRVVRELIILGEEIVVIEQREDSPRFDEVRKLDVPAIVGDARNPEVLRRAGIGKAVAFVVCTNDDLANLQIASRVREVNPYIRLVMRMFDDEFARTMADRFDISAVMSASLMAAPAFAGAATGTEIIQTFRVADQVLAMGRLEVQPGSKLQGWRVHDIEHELDISIVLLQSNDMVDVHPAHNVTLKPGDVIAVVAELSQIQQLAHDWNRANNHP